MIHILTNLSCHIGYSSSFLAVPVWNSCWVMWAHGIDRVWSHLDTDEVKGRADKERRMLVAAPSEGALGSQLTPVALMTHSGPHMNWNPRVVHPCLNSVRLWDGRDHSFSISTGNPDLWLWLYLPAVYMPACSSTVHSDLSTLTYPPVKVTILSAVPACHNPLHVTAHYNVYGRMKRRKTEDPDAIRFLSGMLPNPEDLQGLKF